MIKNSWKTITLICGAHGDDYSHEMQLKQGPHSLFYSCPEYRSIYGQDHSKKSCNNRLTLDDYEKLLNYLMENSESEDGLVEVDLTGAHWNRNGVLYQVLEHKNGTFKVAVRNDKAMAK